MVALIVVETVALGLLGLLVAGLLRSHAEILRALHGLGVDLDPGRRDEGVTTAPLPTPRLRAAAPTPAGGLPPPATDVVGTDPLGEAVAVGIIGAAHDTLLAFLSTGCRSCQPFWDALAAGAAGPPGSRVAVVVRDPAEESPARLAELAALVGGRLPMIASTRAWEDYRVPGAPHFVLVHGSDGRIAGEGTAATWPQVVDLLGQARADAAAAVAPAVAPAGHDNATRIDRELAAAGIAAGHPSLYPDRANGHRDRTDGYLADRTDVRADRANGHVADRTDVRADRTYGHVADRTDVRADRANGHLDRQ